jgi:hypothetical protein
MNPGVELDLSEGQRKQLREQQARQVQDWVEQRVWDLCDDLAGRGCTTLQRLSDRELAAYARGVKNTLHDVLERFEGKDISIQTLIDGALGEADFRKCGDIRGTPGARLFSYRRLKFWNLALQIRAHRVALLDAGETFDYPRWRGWQKEVWAIERRRVAREEWEEFERLHHELKAVWALSSWLISCESWRDKNWKWRQSQEGKVAA